MKWTDRISETLLPLSNETSDVMLAMQEWSYSGNFSETTETSGGCELCSREQTPYKFELINLHTHQKLKVCHICVGRFESSDAEKEEDLLSLSENDASTSRVINNLVKLSSLDNEFTIIGYLNYVKEKGAFTPNQLATLLWRFDSHDISINPQDYTISARRNSEKEQLKTMEAEKLEKIYTFLSPAQQLTLELSRPDFRPS